MKKKHFFPNSEPVTHQLEDYGRYFQRVFIHFTCANIWNISVRKYERLEYFPKLSNIVLERLEFGKKCFIFEGKTLPEIFLNHFLNFFRTIRS